MLLLMLVCWSSAKGQIRELPPLDSLESGLKVYYNQVWTAEREAYDYNQKGKILQYLPSVGFTLGLPSVSYSSQTLFNGLEGKKARKAALKSIDSRYEIEYNEQLNRLRIEFEKMQLQKFKLELQRKSILTDRKIFAIHQEAFKKKELKPLDYLTKLKAFESIEASISIAEQDFSIAVLEVFKLAHYGLQSQHLYFADGENECIMLQANGR